MSCFYNLCSSSSGNATYIGSLSEGILFDAGIGIRNFAKSLKSVGILPAAIKAIFITHEHYDHIKGLGDISYKYNLPIYASKGTIDGILCKDIITDQKIHIINKGLEIFGYTVTPFRTSHDARESLGFCIKTPDGKKIGICTDLGYVSEEVLKSLYGCDFVMLESNYDESMLMYGHYPLSLKKRIFSKNGHLSNEQCAEAVEKLIKNGTKHFALAHISEKNNLPKIAFDHTKNFLALKGLTHGKDYFLNILNKVNDGRLIEV